MAPLPAIIGTMRPGFLRRTPADRSDAMELGAVEHEPNSQSQETTNATQQQNIYTTRLVAVLSQPMEILGRRNAPGSRNGSRSEGPKSPPLARERASHGRRDETREPDTAEVETTTDTIPESALSPDGTESVARPASASPESRGWRGRIGSKGRKAANPRFLGCFPWIQSNRTRKAVLHCLCAGLSVLLLVAVYIGLSLSQRVSIRELGILLLLIIIMSAVFFCYTIIRLCLMVARDDKDPSSVYDGEDGQRRMSTSDILRTGYAMPRRPIRVVLAQDEDVAGREGEMNKVTPPAYGHWRESVRLDPNRLFWQRNENERQTERIPESETVESGRRPPSYASDDGVQYVMDAMTSSGTTPAVTSVSRRVVEEQQR